MLSAALSVEGELFFIDSCIISRITALLCELRDALINTHYWRYSLEIQIIEMRERVIAPDPHSRF